MFNLGFPELIAIGALALIVIGPKQLPEVAKVLARTINELKRATKDLSGTLANVKSDVRSSVDDIMEDIPTNFDDVEKKLSELAHEEDITDLDEVAEAEIDELLEKEKIESNETEGQDV